MEELISKAIENKSLLEFIYGDKLRVVEPYTFGVSTKGNDTLSAFQIEGGSNSSNQLGWRLYSIDEIENLKVLDATFEPNRNGYNPSDSRMIKIYITA
jgi:predicted DNA-binding transcriptional regulator YafY